MSKQEKGAKKKEKASQAVAKKTVKLLRKATKQLGKIEKLLEKEKASEPAKSVVDISTSSKTPKQKQNSK